MKKIPKEIQFKLSLLGLFDGDWSYVEFKSPSRKGAPKSGLTLSPDIAGLTLVATWVRTDSFIEEPKHELG